MLPTNLTASLQSNEQQPLPQHRKIKNILNSDDEDDELMQQIQKSKQNMKLKSKAIPETDHTPQKQKIQIEVTNIKALTYQQLPQDIIFHLNQIFAFNNRLFITGIMENGQTLNLVAVDSQKQLYFTLKSEYSDTQSFSQAYLQKAKRQIDYRLNSSGITKFSGQFQQKQYVFELEGMPREKRPYYKVRYSFKMQSKDEPKPDWEGQTYKYVFGTTYTPLELFVINSGIKGPCWVKIQKKFMQQAQKHVDSGICAQIADPQFIEPMPQKTSVPFLRVMSISIKAVIPAQVKVKKLFNTNRVDDLHIYAISYSYCPHYQVELKPSKYQIINKTLYLKQFGGKMRQQEYVQCQNEKQMIALFQAEVRKYDPDVLVCHDSSRVLDSLIQRMIKLGDKFDRPHLGRLIYPHEVSKVNQNQRINSTIAGRLLVDTFLHSKDMIKSVDYELQSMATHIRPERAFKGMSEEQTINYLEEAKTFHVIKKTNQEAAITFALMNHLEVLQITRSLSNICGNIWKRSLENQRAERNQFLIMHECSKRDLIIPDKFRKEKNTEEQEEVDRKKYQGGYVLQPKKGIYSDFILLLDFNSLYPSIIRQYNVCFSVINRPKLPLSHYYRSKETVKNKKEKSQVSPMEIQEFQVVPPPKDQCSKEKWGFLPHLIDKIVDRRKKCKKAMKSASAQKCVILDIQQKCYKLVANSIYGCLGFSISRFYSKHLASLITRMGRQALLRAKDIVSSMHGVDVIYGDTDSLMIQPTDLTKDNDREKLFEIKNIAQSLKKLINKEYTNLEIDVDGIFKPLILLMKKKYVARKLTNYDRIMSGLDHDLAFSIEYKGIEVVRRDGFELSRKFLKKTLQILMTTTKNEPQEIYEQIYQFAKKTKEEFPTYNYKDFLFSKQLNKNPKEYTKGETIPHVKVALDRIKAGERQQTLVNHTIYYLVCLPKDKTQDTLSKVCFDDRAYERSRKFPDEKGPLEIDQDYYKRQILQPVGRIIMHLDGFSTDRLCEEIGISDEGRKKFKKQMETQKGQGDAILEGFISHSKIEKSKKLSEELGQVQCKCGQVNLLTEDGKFRTICSNTSCNKSLIPTIHNRLSLKIKEQISLYYSNKYRCKCGKQYSLTPLSPCCKIKSKPRSHIPFELHELIYVAKDICSATYQKSQQPGCSQLQNLRNMIDDFLKSSEYQKIDSLMSLMKI